MPKSIKPAMSNDNLAPFDSQITAVKFSEDMLEIHVDMYDWINTEDRYLLLDEKDLETLLWYLRKHKEKK